MQLRHLGYACINLSLKRTTGRTLRLANLQAERVSQVIENNLNDLQAILEWNLAHGIRFFRIGSSVIPFGSHPEFPIDWQERFSPALIGIRSFVERHNLRLSMHPGQYTVLNSNNPLVVERAVAELEYHAAFLKCVDPCQGTMTLHVGGAYGDKVSAIRAFIESVEMLSPTARACLAVENDDTTFDINDVLTICECTGLPAIFDLFHHQCHHRRTDWQDELPELLERVVATWGERVPKFHLSSARESGSTAHADYVQEEDLNMALTFMREVDGGAPFDLMLEAKAKEGAVLRLLETHAPQRTA